MNNRNVYISIFTPYLVPKQSTFNPMAPEIRFTITSTLNEILKSIGEKYGVDKSDYVRSLILNDLREKEDGGKK